MDIRDLQYVLELARQRSFTKASEALHITQPTLSKMIKSLEDELGVQLFTREGKSVELTDAGRVILEQAGPIVEAFRSLTAELADLTRLGKGQIRIGLPPMVGANFFPGIMSRFRSHYPGLALLLEEAGSKKVESLVAEGDLDLGVVLLPVDETRFDTHTIVRSRLQLAVPPAHPLAAGSRAMLKELAGADMILFREDFGLHDKILQECRKAGFEPNVLYESSQWDFMTEMVAAGLGVSLLPEVICRTLDPARVRVLELTDPVIPWDLAMIWRKKSYLSFAAREWIRFTQELFARSEGDLPQDGEPPRS
ncbi:LysR family transcriptional regulator [Gorillibacterium sp. sgz5001074]|uniref:LysR family transcriptional regulator n=1 Tax=Gorillibacterium sp. sgz5001074 TaxID=3446695 RepID=UPI003F6724DF